MRSRTLVATVIAAVIAATPALTAARRKKHHRRLKRPPSKRWPSAIPLGSRVKLQTRAGRRLTATLMSVSDEADRPARVTRA